MPDLRQIVAAKWKGWKEAALEYRCIIKPCVIMFAVYVIGISAILRANFNYRDDLRRVFNGSKGWESSGRYLSNVLSNLLHADGYLTDISPLPQLLAAFLMALSAGIVWYLLSREKKFTFCVLAALVPLGLSPYFLECFSYKYDAPYMALSVFVSVLPPLFWKRGRKVFFLVSAVSSLIMCLTYQASSGIFPMLVVLLCLKQWNGGQKMFETIKFAVYSAGGYLLGMILYKLFIMPQKNSYVSTKLPPLQDIIPVTAANFIKYFRHVEKDFKVEWLSLMFVLCLAFLYVMVRDTGRKRYLSFFVALVALLVMLAFSFGAYPVLSKPLFQPRAMYGIGVFVALIGLVVSTEKKDYLPKVSCILLAWCFFVFSFTYGNALKEQQNYADFRIAAVINDLNSLDIMLEDGRKDMQLSGGIGYAPVVKNMAKHNRMIKRLLPKQFKSGWRTEEWKFFHYYGIKKIEWNWPRKSGKDFNDYNLPILKDTMYHTIRGKDGRVLVELK